MKRHGTSILEVLFAILIVSIGLLGTLAVMMVAGGTAKNARVTDDASFLARRATHEFDTRGMRDVATWHEWNGSAFQPISVADHTRRHFACYCIDSRFAVANTAAWGDARTFPYTHASNPAGARMRRVAFFGPTLPATTQAQGLVADYLFLGRDDLAYDRPESDRSLPANQIWEGSQARGSHGMYSWMATIVPVVDMAMVQSPTLGGPEFSVTGNQCVLSVVVFHQRPAGFDIDDYHERVVGLDDQGQSVGGVFRLTAPTAARLEVNRGQWIMLSGVKRLRLMTGQTIDIPRFVWYLVVDAEAPQDVGGGYESYASLIGPDWDASLLNKQATIMPGVVTVHEKTVAITPPAPQPPPLPDIPFLPPWPGHFGGP